MTDGERERAKSEEAIQRRYELAEKEMQLAMKPKWEKPWFRFYKLTTEDDS